MKAPVTLLLMLLLVACASPEKKYSRQGISFVVPSGWKITDESDIQGSGYSLSCEKRGLNSSCLVSISWINDSLALDEMAGIYSKEISRNFILKHATPEFGPLERTKFMNREAVRISYTMSLMGIHFEGAIYCFYGPHKTINIMIQEEAGDKEEDKAGIERIRETFTVSDVDSAKIQ